jgi:excisionase family DNA binding protein
VAEGIEWVSTKRAAAYLGITPRTLYSMIDKGGLPAYRFGRVIRLKQSDLEAFVESLRIEPRTLGHLYPGGDDGGDDEPEEDE